jgi:hypothetical protein
MKPKNPSGAKGEQGKRAPKHPPSQQTRRGTPLPNALARLLGAMLGISSKPAKRPIARPTEEPPSPVEQEVEVESQMPEMNALPPEGPEETPLEEETAGSMEQRETPAENSEATRRAAAILAKALSDAEALLAAVGPAVALPPEEPKPPEPPPPAAPDPLEQVQDLLRTLTEHFDRALDRMADERRILIEEALSAGRASREQTERALDRLEQDRHLLTEQVAGLARALERLEQRVDDLSRAVLESQRAPITVAIEEEVEAPLPEEEHEPAFQPNGESLTLVISAVPGFQGLMEVQRSLSRISAIEGASVERYFDGEARIVLTLREPITARQLVEALEEATGQQLQLEESRHEEMRMRVRFQSAAT